MADTSDGRTTPGVTINFELTREESVPVLRWVLKQGKQGKLMRRLLASFVLMVFGGVLIIAGGAAGGSVPVLAGGIGLAVYGLLMLGFFRWRLARGPDRAWEKTLGKAGPRTMTITAEGVHIVTRLSEAMNRWPLYSETTERDEMYLLRLARSTEFAAYVFVPRRAFGSTVDEAEFRRLAAANTNTDFGVTAP